MLSKADNYDCLTVGEARSAVLSEKKKSLVQTPRNGNQYADRTPT